MQVCITTPQVTQCRVTDGDTQPQQDCRGLTGKLDCTCETAVSSQYPPHPCSLYSLLSKHADYVGDSWVHTGQRPIAAISVLLRMIYRCRWECCWRWLYAGESPLEAWHWTRGLSLCVCVLKNTLSLAKGLLSHVCHFSHLPTFVWTQTIKYEMFSFLYPVQW